MKEKKKFNLSKTAAAALLFPSALFAGFVAYSHMRYKRSSSATIAERAVNRRLGYILDTPESTLQYLKNRSLVEDQKYVLPKKKYKSRVSDVQIEGCQTIVFDGTDEKEIFAPTVPETHSNVILYIHGGGYAGEMTKYHAGFCDALAYRAKTKVLAPIYPLSPNHTYQETYDIIEKIYLSLIKTGKSVMLAGDSAGGGFAAAFCQYLDQKNIPQAKKLLLISPWVDLSMSGTGYEEYEAVDPLLKVEGLKVMGKAWAGTASTRHYMLSPLFGDIGCLPETLLFTGTREVFYPDIMTFYEKFPDKEKVSLIAEKGMDHVYPLYPILEAGKAMKQIISFVKD